MAHVHIDPDGELHGVVVFEAGPGAAGAYEIDDDLWHGFQHAQLILEYFEKEVLRQTGLLPDPDGQATP